MPRRGSPTALLLLALALGAWGVAAQDDDGAWCGSASGWQVVEGGALQQLAADVTAEFAALANATRLLACDELPAAATGCQQTRQEGVRHRLNLSVFCVDPAARDINVGLRVDALQPGNGTALEVTDLGIERVWADGQLVGDDLDDLFLDAGRQQTVDALEEQLERLFGVRDDDGDDDSGVRGSAAGLPGDAGTKAVAAGSTVDPSNAIDDADDVTDDDN